MPYTIAEIAAALNAQYAGDKDILMSRVAEPAMAEAHDLALAVDPKYAADLKGSKARAALLWPGAEWQSLNLEAAIFAPRGRLAMADLTRIFDQGRELAPGIHPSCVIDPSAHIAPDAVLGPFCIIGARVRIGAGARLHGHVTIAEDTDIGDNVLLHSGVRIGHGVTIGSGFIAHSGAVIGADGFSFVTPQKSGIEEARASLGSRSHIIKQSWIRIHSLGGVTLGDDVEVGANSTIDRGTIRDTRIGARTKIDNLVQIGHNVVVGEDCLICAQSGIAGSTRLGNRVVMAGRSAASDNISIADDVIITGGSTLMTSARKAGEVFMGTPAIKMSDAIKEMKATRRLTRVPRLAERLAEIETAIARVQEAGEK